LYSDFRLRGEVRILNFIVSAATDVGLIKTVNQDCYCVKVFQTCLGEVVFAILCDGMGGLSNGEVASATLVDAFCNWTAARLPDLCDRGIPDGEIRSDWVSLIHDCNEQLKSYGASGGFSLGTTITAILLTSQRYYIVHVGDTRAYEITDCVRILTQDQTLVAREVERGMLTKDEAKTDPRRSILLQCVGASETVYPDLFFGDTAENAVYMLCCDGFRHEITEEEIYQYLNPCIMSDTAVMKRNLDALIELNKQRQERDNISVVAIRTY